MSRYRSFVAFALLSACALSWAHWPASASAPFESGVVKLYSNGAVIGEWKSVGATRVEGETFVFRVRSGVQDREVRIRGTFSYEVQP